jgi:ABC-2 type transport system ATP-binding protein
MNSIIETSSLTKRFGKITAVEDLTLHVKEGEIYAFLGLNGAGKTTTIRMLLGMVRPTSGTAFVFGNKIDARSTKVWSSVGYLVETPCAYPELTVRENLEIIRRLRRISDLAVVDQAIERLGLSTYADRRARTLSLGNVQRLGLAKALIHNPKMLILDEPANGLDPAGIVEVRELLLDLANQHGVTVFISSHILAEVARLATRFGIIHQGRLLMEKNSEELEKDRRRMLLVDARNRQAARSAINSAGFKISLNEDGPIEIRDDCALAQPDTIAKLLVEAGCPPTLLTTEQEDLESHFLRLVGMNGE